MRRIVGLACALAMGTISPAAYAVQNQCGPRGDIIKVLNTQYQENQRAIGLINEKAVMEIYISPKGTWTMVVTNDAGMSCVLAAGEAWDEMPKLVSGPLS